MSIQTHINVSIFNVIRYLVLNIVVDVVVRQSLDSFEHFRRRFSLHRGCSVTVTGHRIDRYNLVHTFTSRHLVSASLLFFVTALAYAVEVALEYAVDSSSIRYAKRGTVRRMQFETGVCTLDDMFTGDNARDLAFIAEQCVTFQDGTYRLFRSIWVKDDNGNEHVLCEAVQQNLLYEGGGVYSKDVTTRPSSEALELVHTLNENSYQQVGDEWHSLIVLQVRSTDVFLRKGFRTPSTEFSTSFLHIRVAGTKAQCLGFTSGIKGRETAVAHLVGCVDGFEENSSLVIVCGTGLAQVGAQNDAEWSTLVPFEIRTHVPRFLRGFGAEGSAYASFLARSLPQDAINLNKYGIVHRFCDQISLPVRNGSLWEEEYEFASSEVRVTATVEMWGLILGACWAAVVAVAQMVVNWVAAREKMPDKLFGERHIVRRWAEENSAAKLVDGKMKAVLKLEERVKTGRITAALQEGDSCSEQGDTE
eukprot:TRINITY_DN49526_c0_g1_i1.p1 TRINITY_DN49526_c0_g1~~TRINITY_DN49526_c0_g1_i1.p1  ORF type:complete len:476 (+),score=67.42 TRINITY_DN49526_c0_g1_i1:625-2052(+)